MIRPPSRITLTHIKDVIYSAFKGRTPVPLGRWYICDNKNTGLIADYSNEDHCGPCGYQKIPQEDLRQTKNQVAIRAGDF